MEGPFIRRMTLAPGAGENPSVVINPNEGIEFHDHTRGYTPGGGAMATQVSFPDDSVHMVRAARSKMGCISIAVFVAVVLSVASFLIMMRQVNLWSRVNDRAVQTNYNASIEYDLAPVKHKDYSLPDGDYLGASIRFVNHHDQRRARVAQISATNPTRDGERNQTYGALRLETYSEGDLKGLVRMDPDGFVSVNGTSPTETLDVYGALRARSHKGLVLGDLGSCPSLSFDETLKVWSVGENSNGDDYNSCGLEMLALGSDKGASLTVSGRDMLRVGKKGTSTLGVSSSVGGFCAPWDERSFSTSSPVDKALTLAKLRTLTVVEFKRQSEPSDSEGSYTDSDSLLHPSPTHKDVDDDERRWGISSQQIETVFPQAYFHLDSDQLRGSTNRVKAVRIEDTLAAVIASLQALAEENDSLRARIEALESASP